MVLVWKSPEDYSEKLIGSYDSESGAYETKDSNFEYLTLSSGLPYPAHMDKPSVFFFCPEKRLLKFDCLWLLGGVPLVSARLADFLRTHAEADLEFIKPRIINASGIEVSDEFFVVNAVNKVDVVDMERSTASLDDDGDVIFFKTICLKDEGMGVLHVAREARTRNLLITEALADKVIEAGFKGDKGLGFYRNENCRFVPYKGQA